MSAEMAVAPDGPFVPEGPIVVEDQNVVDAAVLCNRSIDPECAHVVDGSHTDRPDPAVEHAKWSWPWRT